MSWKKKLLQSFNLYAITDLKQVNEKTIRDCESALKGGVDILQLRSKILSDLELFGFGQALRVLTLKMRKLLIVNDRLDLAIVLKADGVHLGQEDLPIKIARKLALDKDFIIGKSTHSVDQAKAAEREGADYLGFGPIFSTPTKPTYRSIGLDSIPEVVKKIKVPVVCIGGIDESNIAEVISAGASRVAVVRAIFNHSNAKKAAENLKRKLNYV